MANTASFHLDLSDNINNMAAVQGGYPCQPPMPGGGRKKTRSKGRKVSITLKLEGKIKAKARRGKVSCGGIISSGLRRSCQRPSQLPAFQTVAGGPKLNPVKVKVKPSRSETQNFISSAKYQNWVVETAKYYYNMVSIWRGGSRSLFLCPSEDLNNKVGQETVPSSSPTWSDLLADA